MKKNNDTDMHQMIALDDGSNGNSNIWVTGFTAADGVKFVDSLFARSERASDKTPIVVYINSYGGEIAGLSCMLGAMDAIPNPIVTVVAGFAYSAGAILASHGDMRFVSRYSEIMLHSLQGGSEGDATNLSIYLASLNRLNMRYMALLATNTGQSYEKIKADLSGKDLYLGPTEALAYGVVDQIGMPVLKKAEVEQSEVVALFDKLGPVNPEKPKNKKGRK